MHSWGLRSFRSILTWEARGRRPQAREEPVTPASRRTQITSDRYQPGRSLPLQARGVRPSPKAPPAVRLSEVWVRMVRRLVCGLPGASQDLGPEEWPIQGRQRWRKAFRNIAYGSPDANVSDRWVDHQTRQMDELGLVRREASGSRIVVCSPKEWRLTIRGWVPTPPLKKAALDELALRDEEGQVKDALPRKVWNDVMRMFMDEPSNQTVRRLTKDLEERGLVRRQAGGQFVEFREGFPKVVHRWIQPT